MLDYRNHWGLLDLPFDLAGGRQIFLSSAHRRLIADLTSLMASSPVLIRLEASRNSGLTTLLSYLAQMKGLGHHAIHAIASRDSQEFTAETIAPLLGAVEICQKSGQKDLLNLAVSVIESDFRKGISTIWMLDRPDSSLLKFAMDLAGECDGLSLILADTAESLDLRNHFVSQQKMGQHDLCIGRLSRPETQCFLRSQILEVGGTEGIFSDFASRLIHEKTLGKIGLIQKLADQSMQLAAALKRRQVTADVVADVAEKSHVRAA